MSKTTRTLTNEDDCCGPPFENRRLLLSVKRVSEDAKLPFKTHPNDTGYDLTAIRLEKQLTEKTFRYDTGIQVKPPQGYYMEILPRSSLSKTGYMLSNSVGTIDMDYRGNLLIALTKVDDSCPDLEVPFTKVQLVMRKAELYEVEEVEELDETERGSGGFGSTDRT